MTLLIFLGINTLLDNMRIDLKVQCSVYDAKPVSPYIPVPKGLWLTTDLPYPPSSAHI